MPNLDQGEISQVAAHFTRYYARPYEVARLTQISILSRWSGLLMHLLVQSFADLVEAAMLTSGFFDAVEHDLLGVDAKSGLTVTVVSADFMEAFYIPGWAGSSDLSDAGQTRHLPSQPFQTTPLVGTESQVIWLLAILTVQPRSALAVDDVSRSGRPILVALTTGMPGRGCSHHSPLDICEGQAGPAGADCGSESGAGRSQCDDRDEDPSEAVETHCQVSQQS